MTENCKCGPLCLSFVWTAGTTQQYLTRKSEEVGLVRVDTTWYNYSNLNLLSYDLSFLGVAYGCLLSLSCHQKIGKWQKSIAFLRQCGHIGRRPIIGENDQWFQIQFLVQPRHHIQVFWILNLTHMALILILWEFGWNHLETSWPHSQRPASSDTPREPWIGRPRHATEIQRAPLQRHHRRRGSQRQVASLGKHPDQWSWNVVLKNGSTQRYKIETAKLPSKIDFYIWCWTIKNYGSWWWLVGITEHSKFVAQQWHQILKSTGSVIGTWRLRAFFQTSVPSFIRAKAMGAGFLKAELTVPTMLS